MCGSLKLVIWYQPMLRLVYFFSSLHYEAITQLVSWCSYNFMTKSIFSRSSGSRSLYYLWTSTGRNTPIHPPLSSFIKHLCACVWSMSHFRSSIQGKMGVLLATMWGYDRRIFKNTSSSSDLTSGSLCGIYFGYSSQLIFLKSSPQCGSVVLDHVLSYVSPKAGGWMKTFFVEVLMTGFGLGVYSNCLAALGKEPSPTSGSFSFGALDDHLVVGFVGDIVPVIKTTLQRLCKEQNRIRNI
jgi:hypothetical protein